MARAGEEAEILRVGLARDRAAPASPRSRAPAACASPSGKRRRCERLGRERREHVALVLARRRVAMRSSAPVLDARVVAGRERLRAEALGELEHRVEAHVAVAAHAGVRRQPGARGRRASRRRRRRGTRRAGRSRGAPCRARARARARRARPAPSSSSTRRRSRDRTTARASRRRPRRRRARRAAPRLRCRRRRSSRRACACAMGASCACSRGFGDALGNDVSRLEAIIPTVAGLLALFRHKGWPVIHTRESHQPDLATARRPSCCAAAARCASAMPARWGESWCGARPATPSSTPAPRSTARSSSTSRARACSGTRTCTSG